MKRFNPPASTKSYRSKEKIDSFEYFDADRFLSQLEPTEDEWKCLYRAAIASTAYNTRRGAKSPFPAPVDFIDELNGYNEEHEPVWEDRVARNRSTLMLRTVSRLIAYIGLIEVDEYRYVDCPICDTGRIKLGIGCGVMYDKKLMAVRLDFNWKTIVSIDVECSCKEFTTTDYRRIEKLV